MTSDVLGLFIRFWEAWFNLLTYPKIRLKDSNDHSHKLIILISAWLSVDLSISFEKLVLSEKHWQETEFSNWLEPLNLTSDLRWPTYHPRSDSDLGWPKKESQKFIYERSLKICKQLLKIPRLSLQDLIDFHTSSHKSLSKSR